MMVPAASINIPAQPASTYSPNPLGKGVAAGFSQLDDARLTHAITTAA